MKPATFVLANLNLTVSISADARRWVQEHVVSLETYAWQQAQRRQAGLPLDIGVTVTLDRENDRGGKPAAQAQQEPSKAAADFAKDLERRGCIAPVASAPAPVEVRYLLRSKDPAGSELLIYGDEPHWCARSGRTGNRFIKPIDAELHGGYYTEITPAAAATWLRANGHTQAADGIEVLDAERRGQA